MNLNWYRCRVAIAHAVGTVAVTFALAGSAAAAVGDQSPDGVWTEVDRSVLAGVTQPLPTAFRVYRANTTLLKGILASAPMEDLRVTFPPNPVILTLPADGMFPPVSVVKSPILAPTLAALYPSIQTYAVRGVVDFSLIGRLTETLTTFQALLRPSSDPIRIQPIKTTSETFYLSFLIRNGPPGSEDFIHAPDEQGEPTPPGPRSLPVHTPFMTPDVHKGLLRKAVSSGPTLRTYRLVVATTGEYYQARNLGNGDTDVVASIVAEVNNANAVFEPEVAVRLTLVNTVLFNDPTMDPYGTGITACQLRDANQNAIEVVGGILSANYDIGFAFGQGGGNGCAWYVVCLADKARGAGLISTGNPAGNATGLLVHEMGHQLGAHHTFSGTQGSCTNIEYNPGHGYEPGSGSTIMSYRGICGTDNVDTSLVAAGRYYNTHSFDEIVTNTTSGSGSTCGTTSMTGNSAPSVNAGGDYTIPQGTPFTLTGSATDPNSDPLTYTWEQFDPAASQRAIDTDLGEGPIFRSVPPTASPSRTFPNLSDILSNTQRKGEILPSTNRTLNFRLTARDNRSGGGGVAYDGAVLTVSGSPFFITSPNGGETFGSACPIPVTWTVGGGSVAANVNLDFSKDGGQTFPTTLLASTANDASASVVAPCEQTNTARMRAAAVGNVFFDISNNNFTVNRVPPTVSTSATGGSVDNACKFTVNFSATISDDCGTSKNDVTVEATKVSNNFTLGAPTFNAVQVDSKNVSVSGSVLVSNLTSSPAVLNIKVNGLDACADKGSDTKQVQVIDDTPPTISVSLDPTSLWPPNHKLNDITATVVAQDNCGGVSYVLTSITSSEPDNGLGDGDTENDIQGASLGTADTAFKLRAERSGMGPGRTYTVKYTATDGSNNGTSAQAVVTVPHSKN